MTIIERIKLLKEWRDRRDYRLLKQAHEFANWYTSEAIAACEQAKIDSAVWQSAHNDLQLFLKVLWCGHDHLFWQMLAYVVYASTEVSERYTAQLHNFMLLLNWWSSTALRALQSGEMEHVAYAVCAYEELFKAYLCNEAVNLLRVCLPFDSDESRLRCAELVAVLRHASPADVFASALEQLSWEPKGNESEPLQREARLQLNPSGTGKNPEHEHEVAESNLPLPEDAPSPLEFAPSSEPDPAEMVADRDAVERTLARFGKRTADLLSLMLEGRTAAEAARELGISEGTARKLLERARKQFSRNP